MLVFEESPIQVHLQDELNLILPQLVQFGNGVILLLITKDLVGGGFTGGTAGLAVTINAADTVRTRRDSGKYSVGELQAQLERYGVSDKEMARRVVASLIEILENGRVHLGI